MMDQRRGRQRTARQLVYGTLATASRGTQDHVGEGEKEREGAWERTQHHWNAAGDASGCGDCRGLIVPLTIVSFTATVRG